MSILFIDYRLGYNYLYKHKYYYHCYYYYNYLYFYYYNYNTHLFAFKSTDYYQLIGKVLVRQLQSYKYLHLEDNIALAYEVHDLIPLIL